MPQRDCPSMSLLSFRSAEECCDDLEQRLIRTLEMKIDFQRLQNELESRIVQHQETQNEIDEDYVLVKHSQTVSDDSSSDYVLKQLHH